eukprot:1772610-Karenia_brevis.AAC.1
MNDMSFATSKVSIDPSNDSLCNHEIQEDSIDPNATASTDCEVNAPEAPEENVIGLLINHDGAQKPNPTPDKFIDWIVKKE